MDFYVLNVLCVLISRVKHFKIFNIMNKSAKLLQSDLPFFLFLEQDTGRI